MFKKFVAGVAGMIVGDFLWDCIIQPKPDELALELDSLNDLECYDDEGIECEDCELRDECAATNEHVGEEHFADTEKATPKKHSEHHHFQDARGSFWHVEYLMDEDGNPIRDKDGEPVIRRLAGENSDERSAETIQPDENGVYTLSGLQLSEGSDFRLNLRLEGAQYLKEGVYIYTAHGGVEKSQSIVGIAEGTHTVDVSVGMTVRFEADEDKYVAEKRKWRTEDDTEIEPPKAEINPDPTPRPPKHEHIIDPNEIELAKPVKTGDMSFALMGMALASAIGLMGVLLAGRRANKN